MNMSWKLILVQNYPTWVNRIRKDIEERRKREKNPTGVEEAVFS